MHFSWFLKLVGTLKWCLKIQRQDSRVVTLTDTGVPSLFWTKAMTCTSYWAPGSSWSKSTAVTAPPTSWLCSSPPTAAHSCSSDYRGNQNHPSQKKTTYFSKLSNLIMACIFELDPSKETLIVTQRSEMHETINGQAIDYHPFSSKIHDKPSLPEHQPKWLGQPLHGSSGLAETWQCRSHGDLALKVRT